ncbi:hypothetical protein [Nocardia sp. NPDC050435]|uniref:hypothetical protein n=1 Tax=Nocardia sp. NPDC050435 TaxID=3155040 RepID=UPI0033EBDA88
MNDNIGWRERLNVRGSWESWDGYRWPLRWGISLRAVYGGRRAELSLFTPRGALLTLPLPASWPTTGGYDHTKH